MSWLHYIRTVNLILCSVSVTSANKLSLQELAQLIGMNCLFYVLINFCFLVRNSKGVQMPVLPSLRMPMSTSHVLIWYKAYTRGLKHAGSMWPARPFCEARDAFWEISNNLHLGCQVPWKRCREIIEPKLNDTQCGFSFCRSITGQILTLQ